MTEPKIRFKAGDGSAFPDWEEKSLSEIFTERAETSVISDDAPLLSFTIEQGVINPEDKKSNKRDFLMKDKESKKFAVTELNDIIYNPANLKFGAIHRNKLGRGVVSPIYAIFHTEQNPVFVEHVVRNPAFIKKSLTFLEGTVEKLKTLKPRDFLRMKVFIPTLPEQQRIADFLNNVDEVIAVSEEEVANLEQQKKTMMQKIFSQEVRFKKEDGSDFPDWEGKMLGEAITFVNGRAYKQEELLATGKYLVLRVGNLFTNNEYYYSDLELDDDKYIDNGDLIYAWSATFGPRIYQGEKCIYHYHIWKCLFDDESYSKNFLNQLLLNDVESIKRVQNGFAMMHITKENMENRVLKIPSLPEQQLIADFLTSYDEAITAAKQELAKWKELKKGMLQQMFV